MYDFANTIFSLRDRVHRDRPVADLGRPVRAGSRPAGPEHRDRGQRRAQRPRVADPRSPVRPGRPADAVPAPVHPAHDHPIGDHRLHARPSWARSCSRSPTSPTRPRSSTTTPRSRWSAGPRAAAGCRGSASASATWARSSSAVTFLLEIPDSPDPIFFIAGILFAIFAIPMFLVVRDRRPGGRGADHRRRPPRLAGPAARDDRPRTRACPGCRGSCVGRFFYTDAVNTVIVVMSVVAVKAVGLTQGQWLMTSVLADRGGHHRQLRLGAHGGPGGTEADAAHGPGLVGHRPGAGHILAGAFWDDARDGAVRRRGRDPRLRARRRAGGGSGVHDPAVAARRGSASSSGSTGSSARGPR